MKRLAIVTMIAGVTALLQLQPASGRDSRDLGPQPPGQFDFYALSLTWVPEFCATHVDANECRQGLGFALHGLWPESNDGYPTSCSRELLPADVRASFQGLYASPGLIDHEWQVHGVCSGLGPLGFLQATNRFFNSIALPSDLQSERSLASGAADGVRAEMIAANPQLTPESIVLVCERSQIKEMHVCLGQDGSPRACVEWERSEGNCR